MERTGNMSEYNWWAKDIHRIAAGTFGDKLESDPIFRRVEQFLRISESPEMSIRMLIETIMILRENNIEITDMIARLEAVRPTPHPMFTRKEDECKIKL
jgi:hypothetical protein